MVGVAGNPLQDVKDDVRDLLGGRTFGSAEELQSLRFVNRFYLGSNYLPPMMMALPPNGTEILKLNSRCFNNRDI